MSASEVQRGSSTGKPRTRPAPGLARGIVAGRGLRPSAKVLPEHARGHNRALVLQTLYRADGLSRADLARATGLTRVTISDLVADLISDGYVIELDQREESRPGKPGTPVDINRGGHSIIGLDLSGYHSFRGAVLDLDGTVLRSEEIPLDNAIGDAAIAKVIDLAVRLAAGTTTPVLGLGVGSPGVVDFDGIVLTAPNLGWVDVPLRAALADATGLSVLVANDANVAALAEHSFGESHGDMMLVKVGHGVGAGVLLDATLISGSRHAAGEIGHVVVGTDQDAPSCACGKHGCLETWLAEPRLEQALATASDDAARAAVLTEAGRRLGIALAPVVGALNLSEVVLSGPPALLYGALRESAVTTLRARTMDAFHGDLELRMSVLGEDIVMRGAAAMVLSGRLGVS